MSIDFNNKICLVLAPHTDDGELGCGATIHKIINQGAKLFYVAFSACEQSVLPQFPSDILITEVKQATRVLDIPENNLILLKYGVRTFSYQRQEILDDILQIKKDIKPDIVFIPSLNDIHQDHSTVANEAIRAFKFSTILCYELPWNNFNFNTACFFQLDDENLNAKVNALKQYQSQVHRPYANEEFVRGLAKIRGVQSGLKYAEVFEIIRLVIK